MKRAALALAAILILSVPFVLIGPRPEVAAAPQGWTGPTFKVATWNIRSGMGIRGFNTTNWNHDTLNCTDPASPMNAWGIGLPQAELRRVAADTSIIALALQEAWNCASPRRVNAVVGFTLATDERQGVALLARYGMEGDPIYRRIDAANDRWVIGGHVCLDPRCSRTVPIFSTHFGAPTVDGYPSQARALVSALASAHEPHLFMGDLNVFRRDRWNPPVPCTGMDQPGRVMSLDTIESAGYADAWKATQSGEGWSGMASRRGCGRPEGNLYKRIDYVFTKGLMVVATKQFARVAPGTDSPSDHAGLVAELAVPDSD
jgi:endonuclease/exonuclease/phosphatase family metal-dependent hydrolase